MIQAPLSQGPLFAAGVPVLQQGFVDRMTQPIEELITDVITLDPVLFQLLIFGILLGGVYGLAALGLTIIFGVMDVINFAHGVYMTVGMYVVWAVSTNAGIDPILLMPLAVLVVFALGIGTHVTVIEPIIDREAESHLLVTFAIVLILEATLQIWFQPDPRKLEFSLGNFDLFTATVPIIQLIAGLLAVAAVTVTWLFLYRTRTGRAIRATADSRTDAKFVGINVPRINYLTFGLGAALAGLAGATISLYRLFDPFIGTTQYLAIAFVIVVLGGLGSLPGALAGGIIIGLVQTYASFYLHGSSFQVIVMTIFILVLLLKPSGLFGSEVSDD
jgi:branched-chain amino acid transport system permease protein